MTQRWALSAPQVALSTPVSIALTCPHLPPAQAGAASPRTAGGSGVLRCGLLLLQVLAEEADGADRGRRQALVGRAPSPVLAALLQGAQGQQGQGQGEASGLAAQRGAVIGMAREVLAAAGGAEGARLSGRGLERRLGPVGRGVRGQRPGAAGYARKAVGGAGSRRHKEGGGTGLVRLHLFSYT